MQTIKRSLGDLAAAHPAATRVFLRHRLDFCCGGKQSLEEAFRKAGLDGEAVYMPIRVMESEHESHADQLARIRELTRDLTLPSYACATWTALYGGLEAMEAELLQHIHLENNILFSRAIRGAA